MCILTPSQAFLVGLHICLHALWSLLYSEPVELPLHSAMGSTGAS